MRRLTARSGRVALLDRNRARPGRTCLNAYGPPPARTDGSARSRHKQLRAVGAAPAGGGLKTIPSGRWPGAGLPASRTGRAPPTRCRPAARPSSFLVREARGGSIAPWAQDKSSRFEGTHSPQATLGQMYLADGGGVGMRWVARTGLRVRRCRGRTRLRDGWACDSGRARAPAQRGQMVFLEPGQRVGRSPARPLGTLTRSSSVHGGEGTHPPAELRSTTGNRPSRQGKCRV